MSIRLALIGAGIMGSDHARIFAEELPGATLQVICDASLERAKELADRVGAKHVLSDPKPRLPALTSMRSWSQVRTSPMRRFLWRVARRQACHVRKAVIAIAAGMPVRRRS